MKNLEKISTRQPIPEVVTEPATKPSKHKKYELIRKFINKIIAEKKDKWRNISELSSEIIVFSNRFNWSYTR